MSAFKQAIGAETRPAPRVETLSPSDFAETYSKRPHHDIAVGIRVPSEKQYRAADYEGGKESGDDAYNRRVMDIIVAAGICDPNDVTASHPFLQLVEDSLLAKMFKPRTIKRLFDAIELVAVEQSPLFPEATDEELDDLWGFLTASGDRFAGMSRTDQMRCRRYLRFALDHFIQVSPEPETAAQ